MINAEFTYRDSAGLLSKTVIKDIPTGSAPDLTKMATLGTAIKALSNAAISQYALLTWDSTIRTPTVTTPTGLNRVKGLVRIMYPHGDDFRYRVLMIPNVNATDHYELITDEGAKMKQASLSLLTAALSAAAGFTVTALEGKLISRSIKRQGSASGHSIQFKDAAGNISNMGIPDDILTDADALDTLAGALETDEFSLSAILSSKYLTKLASSTDIGTPGADATHTPLFDTVKTWARAKFSYKIGTDVYYMDMEVPAVKSSACDGTGKNWRFLDASGTTMKTALNTFFGAANRVLDYENGKVRVYKAKE